MNRRTFLRDLLIGASAAVIAPEQLEELLWTPVKKIFVMPAAVYDPMCVTPKQAAQIVDAMRTLFNPPVNLSDSYKKYLDTYGIINHEEWVKRHVMGDWGAPDIERQNQILNDAGLLTGDEWVNHPMSGRAILAKALREDDRPAVKLLTPVEIFIAPDAQPVRWKKKQ